jgi:L-glyceraldehyde 3-phosphate reductase
MIYRRCGHSGIKLPVLSLGLWHNFGDIDSYDVAHDMVLTAFEQGICHFDLANNYGPPPGSAERNFGRILSSDLKTHRDELFISSKAGHDMWEGVYGTGSSRKNIIASCDQSLQRTGLDYFDIFYSHRYDPETPIEETMQALIDLVKQGKALYVGISKYPADKQAEAYAILQEAKVPCLLSQYRCSIFDQKAKHTNFESAQQAGSGIICFSPLAQGLLSGKYNQGIPADSRVAKGSMFLQASHLTQERIEAAKKLDELAQKRQQTLAQMSLAWVLNDERVTSVIIGTSSPQQLMSNLKALQNLSFTEEELQIIDVIADNPLISF